MDFYTFLYPPSTTWWYLLKKITMRNILLIAVLFISTLSAFANNTLIEISGTITDKETEKPITYALVSVQNTNDFTQTDENGKFNLTTNLTEFTIDIYHLNYETKNIVWKNDLGKSLTIQMKPKFIDLDAILVSDNPIQKSAQTDVLHNSVKAVSQPVDVGDMFRDIAGFGVIKRGGYAMEPVFRSFKYEQLNLVYDGGTQLTYACPNRMDPATTHVTPEEIERIEIIKGPFSVRYGQTMGGIINLVTHTPKHSDKFKMNGVLEGGYEFNGNSKFTRLSLGGSQKKIDFNVNGGLKQFGNYNDGDGVEVPSSFNTYDYATKLGWSPTSNQRLQVQWRQSFGRDILHVGLPMDTDIDNSNVATVDYSIKNVSPKVKSITAKVYGSSIEHVMSNTLRPNRMMVEAVATVYAQTAGGRAEVQLMPSSKSLLYFGGDFRYVGRDGERDRKMLKDMMGNPLPMPMTMTDLIWQDSRLMDYGLFAEHRLYLSDAMTISGGLRLDIVNSEINNPAQDFVELYGDLTNETEFNISGNVTMNYELSRKLTLQAALGRGTRSATIPERYINHFSIGNDGFEYVGNPNLTPEANHQAEVSLHHHTDKLHLSGSVFYSYITDYITVAVDSTLPRKYMPMNEPRFSKRFQNIDAAMQTGFEANAAYEIVKNFSVYGMIGYTYAQNLDWDEPLAEVPPMSSNIGVKYDNEKIWADIRGRFVATQSRFSPSFVETETPGFNTFDIRLGYNPIKNISIGAAILNVFDATYYEHLNRSYQNMGTNSMIYESGRNVTLFLRAKF